MSFRKSLWELPEINASFFISSLLYINSNKGLLHLCLSYVLADQRTKMKYQKINEHLSQQQNLLH